jgi:hypothetical protein
MVSIHIPYSFIREYVFLSWRDALWGYEHQLICWSDIVAMAEDRLSLVPDNSTELELAFLGKSDTQQIGELLRDLSNNEPDDGGNLTDKKWLFLVLAWLFKNKEAVADPLAEVASIYADFNYPTEIESFVNYMPVTDGYDPSNHSIEENKARLYSKWEEYLSKTKRTLDEIEGKSGTRYN